MSHARHAVTPQPSQVRKQPRDASLQRVLLPLKQAKTVALPCSLWFVVWPLQSKVAVMSDPMMRGKLVPIKSVYVGMDCAYCQKKPSEDVMPGNNDSLSACTGCHAARYCSKKCQAADWKAVGRQTSHKPICKLLKAFRSMHQNTPNPPPDDPNGENSVMLGLLTKYQLALPALCMMTGVSPNYNEASLSIAKNFISGCRVCAICGKNEYDGAAGDTRDWPHCEKCGYGWCCSEEHWKEYQVKGAHTEEICRTYNRAIECERFKWEHV